MHPEAWSGRRLRGRREAVRRLAAGVALLCAGALACGSGPPAATGRYQRVVLVTIDTLRADHLGAYGFPLDSSPFFDRLAAHGVLFDRAYAATSTTTPSHASLFTSLYPIQHGVLKNGLVLDAHFVTLAEVLSDAGVLTAGFAATDSHFATTQVAQGFQVMNEPDLVRGQMYRRADATVDAALHWLETVDPGRRFLLWIHLYEPHLPRVPPAAYRELVTPHTQEERSAFVHYLTEVEHVPLSAFRRGAAGMVRVHSGYAAEIRFADDQLARLFDAMKARGFGDGTLWILTADHGEGLGNHDYRHHGRHVYDEQVRVPLLFYAARPPFAPRRVPDLVELVDLFPTITALLGVADTAPPGTRQGRSLVPLLDGAAVADADREAFVQRRSYSEADRRFALDASDFELGEKFALVGPRWKYIHRSIGADELYDLAVDPYETRNLVDAKPELAARMRERLLARARKLRAGSTVAVPVDAETRARLRALGYAP